MNLRKTYRRFCEFGGSRLILAYWRMGVSGTVFSEILRYLLGQCDIGELYVRIQREVTPVLRHRYNPLLYALKEKYAQVQLPHEQSNRVWFCWLQGMENAPELVRVCLHSQQALLTDREIVVITLENYRQYVTLPDFFVKKYEKGLIPHALFSDLLRLELLLKYGGTWMDATLLVTSRNYPPHVLNCDLFMFQYFNEKDRRPCGVSNWFITSCTNNRLLLILRDMLFQYWRDYNCTVNYHIFHLFFSWIACEFPEEYRSMPRGHAAVAIELGRKMESGQPYDEAWMSEKLAHCCFHKLSHRTPGRIKSNPDSYYQHILKFAQDL